MSARQIITTRTRAPVPFVDWCATFSDYDPERNDPIAYAATEAEAVAELLAQVDANPMEA